jgi:hypothetical protein
MLQYFSTILKAIKFRFFSYDKTMWMIPIHVIFIKTLKDFQFYVLNSLFLSYNSFHRILNLTNTRNKPTSSVFIINFSDHSAFSSALFIPKENGQI